MVRDLAQEIVRVEKAYAPIALGIVDLALRGERAEASLKIITECRPLQAQMIKVTDNYAEVTRERSIQFIAEAEDRYWTQRNRLMAACLLAVGLAFAVTLLITRDLTRALGGEPAELCEVVSHAANGDLTTRLQVRNGDTTSVLAAVDRMQLGLIRIVSTVRQGAENLATASAQIESGNRDLSARTESQASALEETASSMEQLSASVVQNADNAREANQLAQNAAVEAARTGEQGRGFAVVASEVRSLAGRSAEAANKIKGLISASVERVGQGTVLVDQARTTMNDVVASIKRVTDLVGKISLASNEQASGVAQAGEAVTQMDQATQNNAALVEEMAAAASSLKSQATELVQTVSAFNIGQSTGSRLMLA
jgi:methyl-accepting chemotaxis protein